jgi:hypothetical protein
MMPMRAPQAHAAGVLASLVIAATALLACGGRPPIPRRGVVEADVGSWKFRRFQPVLDVEVWVPDNKAEAFTASYVSDTAERRGHIDDNDVVNGFVTRYQRAGGVLRETVKLARRLAQESGYEVEDVKVGGVRSVSIVGHGEAWVMWAAGSYVVKVGGRGRQEVPESVVTYYAERYPSEMPGSALEGPLPPGEGGPAKARPAAKPYDSSNPSPDWEGYNPQKPLPKPRQPADAP